jgi:hypothetical protein
MCDSALCGLTGPVRSWPEVGCTAFKLTTVFAEFAGLYQLVPTEDFDDRPVYRKLVNNNATANMFFDGEAQTWNISPFLDENAHVDMWVHDSAPSPDLITEKWRTHGNDEADSVAHVTCTAGPAMGEGVSDGSSLPGDELVAVRDSKVRFPSRHCSMVLTTHCISQCLAWVPYKSCKGKTKDPSATNPTGNSSGSSCTTMVGSDTAGHCACANGRELEFPCGHSRLNCHAECKVLFPYVIAQSLERMWTHQLASNLVLPTGG